MRNILIKLILFIFISWAFNSFIFSDNIPSCMLNYKFGKEKNIIIVEKSSQKLYIYSNYSNKPVKTFGITTGKKNGQKYLEGDMKTPEGIYYFRRTLSGNELPKIDDYGEKAFTMNYPNPIDKMARRKGSGIWLHGAFDSNKVETAYSSRGCVVMKNKDLNIVSKYVFLNDTPIFIYKTIKYSTEREIVNKRGSFLKYIKNWKESWESKKIDDYIESYSTLFRYNNMNISEFKQYKKRLNNSYKFIKVKLSDITLYSFENYFFASFNQLYVSDTNQFYSKKIQYWNTDRRPKIAFETTLQKQFNNKIEISKGNYITINQYRRNILNELKDNSFTLYPSSISLSKIDKKPKSITLHINNRNRERKYKTIPVILLKKDDESVYKTLNNISLKNGVPQEKDQAVELDNGRNKSIDINTGEDYFINSISLFIFDNNNNFKQILTYFIKK